MSYCIPKGKNLKIVQHISYVNQSTSLFHIYCFAHILCHDETILLLLLFTLFPLMTLQKSSRRHSCRRMTDRGEADGERKSGSAFAPRLSFGLWEPINPTSRAIRLTELSAVWCSEVCARASAHSRGQMQFGCHRRAYFWTSVACMSIIHAFHDYVRLIMLISPPFHLRRLSARLHYQRGGDSV